MNYDVNEKVNTKNPDSDNKNVIISFGIISEPREAKVTEASIMSRELLISMF